MSCLVMYCLATHKFNCSHICSVRFLGKTKCKINGRERLFKNSIYLIKFMYINIINKSMITLYKYIFYILVQVILHKIRFRAVYILEYRKYIESNNGYSWIYIGWQKNTILLQTIESCMKLQLNSYIIFNRIKCFVKSFVLR